MKWIDQGRCLKDNDNKREEEETEKILTTSRKRNDSYGSDEPDVSSEEIHGRR